MKAILEILKNLPAAALSAKMHLEKNFYSSISYISAFTKLTFEADVIPRRGGMGPSCSGTNGVMPKVMHSEYYYRAAAVCHKVASYSLTSWVWFYINYTTQDKSNGGAGAKKPEQTSAPDSTGGTNELDQGIDMTLVCYDAEIN